MNQMVAGSRARTTAHKESGGLLYGWLLVAIFFEYARPGAFVPALAALPLNSAIPLGLLLVTCFASRLRPVETIWRDRTTRWLLFYFGLVALSVLHASVQTYAWRVFIATLGYLFLFIVIVRIVTTQARLHGVIATLLVSHVFLVGMNPNAVLNPEARNYIIGGTFLGDGNDFALSLCILLPLSVGLALALKARFRRTLVWIFSAVVLLAIIASQSRGGTLGLAAALGYLWWGSKRRGYGIFALGLCAVGVLMYAPEAYFQRMRTISTYEADSSATARIAAWKAGAKMALHNPVLGVGSGNFPNNFPRYRDADGPRRWMTAHSMYFLVLGELGLPGIVALLALVFGSLRANRQIEKSKDFAQQPRPPPEAAAGLHMVRYLNAAIVGFAVAGAFLSVAYYPHIFMLAALCVAQRALLAPGPTAPAGAGNPSPRVAKPVG